MKNIRIISKKGQGVLENLFNIFQKEEIEYYDVPEWNIIDAKVKSSSLEKVKDNLVKLKKGKILKFKI